MRVSIQYETHYPPSTTHRVYILLRHFLRFFLSYLLRTSGCYNILQSATSLDCRVYVFPSIGGDPSCWVDILNRYSEALLKLASTALAVCTLYLLVTNLSSFNVYLDSLPRFLNNMPMLIRIATIGIVTAGVLSIALAALHGFGCITDTPLSLIFIIFSAFALSMGCVAVFFSQVAMRLLHDITSLHR